MVLNTIVGFVREFQHEKNCINDNYTSVSDNCNKKINLY